MDGNVETFFDGVEPNNQYVGIDLGAEIQTTRTEVDQWGVLIPLHRRSRLLRPRRVSGRFASPVTGVRLRPEEGEKYKGPIKVKKSVVMVAVAYTDQLAASEPVIAPYRIGQVARDEKTVRTFHIGNSLTDTVVGWLQAGGY